MADFSRLADFSQLANFSRLADFSWMAAFSQLAAFSWLTVQNNYEISEYLLEPDVFMQRLLVQILFVFFISAAYADAVAECLHIKINFWISVLEN